eukprot:IDg23855t1
MSAGNERGALRRGFFATMTNTVRSCSGLFSKHDAYSLLPPQERPVRRPSRFMRPSVTFKCMQYCADESQAANQERKWRPAQNAYLAITRRIHGVIGYLRSRSGLFSKHAACSTVPSQKRPGRRLSRFMRPSFTVEGELYCAGGSETEHQSSKRRPAQDAYSILTRNIHCVIDNAYSCFNLFSKLACLLSLESQERPGCTAPTPEANVPKKSKSKVAHLLEENCKGRAKRGQLRDFQQTKRQLASKKTKKEIAFIKLVDAFLKSHGQGPPKSIDVFQKALNAHYGPM